ncbi:hypothetical protein RQP46_004573 [Phenoliferia psychrophenolica]
MTARLESIESTLTRAQISFPTATSPSGRAGTSDSATPSFSNVQHFKPSSDNPVETAGEAMAVEGLVDLSAPGRSAGDPWSGGLMLRPDVIERGIMSVAECEAEVDIYYERIHPWMATLSSVTYRDITTLREKPLLFHSMLLLTLYYRPRTPSNIMLYRAVSAIVDTILCPIILCAQPDQLNSDLIRSLYLLVMYKPVQYSAMNARGIADPSVVEHSSKMNVRASWMLRTMCAAISTRIALPSITVTFARAFSNQHHTPIPEDVINDQRLYFAYIWHSMHGGLQSGASVDAIPQEALKTTRLFASLRREPCDVRLAASVELAATAALLLSTRKEGDKVEPEDLARFDQEMDAWAAYWIPVLNAQSADELNYTTQYPYAAFIQVVINGYAFSRWKTERKELARASASIMGPLLALPVLLAADRDSISRAVRAAEGMILALTVEGRAELAAKGHQMIWSGVGSTLTLDDQVIGHLRWSSDSLTCVVYSYSLIFLAKLANEGLLGGDLQLIAAGSSPIPLSPLDPTDKLCRLLLLGADALDAFAPNAHHPAIKQAAFLRRIRDAGISGSRGILSAPGSPHLAAVAGSRGVPSLHHPPTLSYPFAASLDASPVHSPHGEDPFASLLGGVSPSVFSDHAFFGIDVGDLTVDWDGLERDMGGSYEF